VLQEKRGWKKAPAPIQNGSGNDAEPGLALARLEAHLWNSANILRGSVDAADWDWQRRNERARFPGDGAHHP